MSLEQLALHNMETRFVDNPCRGIVLGANQEGHLVQLAWIMGRSENSQNRIYVVEDGVVKTKAFDPSKVKDPSLIIYNVMRAHGNVHIVSNGDQTDTIYENFDTSEESFSEGFYKALSTRFCEPDQPVFTPRISGYQHFIRAHMSILKANPFARQPWNEAMASAEARTPEEKLEIVENKTGMKKDAFPTVRQFFSFPLSPGYGYCLTTYQPGSKELPSFDGEPFVVPITGALEDTMQQFWQALEPQWRVALVGKEMSDGTYRIAEPINKHKVA